MKTHSVFPRALDPWVSPALTWCLTVAEAWGCLLGGTMLGGAFMLWWPALSLEEEAVRA